MHRNKLTLPESLPVDEPTSPLLDLPVELHMLILEELKADPLGMINFYITCLSSKHQWMERKARPYFFHALNHLAPTQFLDVRKLFTFNKRTGPKASAYHQLRQLAHQNLFSFISFAFFTDDIRSLDFQRVKFALAWLRAKHPTYVNAIDNLKGILTALIYERDHDLINHSYNEIKEWNPDDIAINDIYPIRCAYGQLVDDLTQQPPLTVHQFPATICFFTHRGSYHNLAKAYLADAHISGSMMYFKRATLWNCYLPSISADNNYFFLNTHFANTFIVKRTHRGNKLTRPDGTAVALPTDNHFGLVIDLKTLSQNQFIQLIRANTLSLDQFVLDFRLNLDDFSTIAVLLGVFNDLQPLYDYDDVTVMRQVCVDAVLAALQVLVNNSENEKAEVLYQFAFNHPCFQPRANENPFGLGLFGFRVAEISTSQRTLQDGYSKMKRDAGIEARPLPRLAHF